ncbi:MAG: hypothetical protein JWQ31_2131 [Mycobacterium sp.]|nr:hypothetical protein [Mycobacterium sp.]
MGGQTIPLGNAASLTNQLSPGSLTNWFVSFQGPL